MSAKGAIKSKRLLKRRAHKQDRRGTPSNTPARKRMHPK